MFPYPSGAGLHVGHPEAQRPISSAVSNVRKVTMSFTQWDGMPLACSAEQYAMDTEMTQRITAENI